MKSVDLISIVSAKEKLPPALFGKYIRQFGISKQKEHEYEDLKSLKEKLIQHKAKGLRIFDGFYVGYTIERISKEFDLLRFGQNAIVNIELKRKKSESEIKKQLLRNRFYLRFTKRKVFNFTYVSDSQKLYYLDTEDLKEVDVDFLCTTLRDQHVDEIDDIDKMFAPSNYLISPFNDTDRFMSDEYFLSGQQEEIQNAIKDSPVSDGSVYFSIKGEAGTGKTLLVYDMIKKYTKDSRKALVIHCGNLNPGQIKLVSEFKWDIRPIKDYLDVDYNAYDLIVIDEAQRIYTYQLDEIIRQTNETAVKVVFSLDPKQCLHNSEIQKDIDNYITQKVQPNSYTLSKKIRTNPEIAAFVNNLFDLNQRNNNLNYEKAVKVKYFFNVPQAKAYFESLYSNDWKVMAYTPEKGDTRHDGYRIIGSESAHSIIGQEFDRVAVIVNQNFYYDEGKKLQYGSDGYYNSVRMLHQMVTRAKTKLCVIVIGNETVLEHALNIICNNSR